VNKSKGEPFVMLPRDLLSSDAWRSLSINARRLIDLLMLEHLRHGGRRNGLLMAPRDQLESFGIGRHFISGAIEEVERVGLVDCKRGIGRRPSIYSLTWLPLSDDSPPSNHWRSYAVAGAKQHLKEMGAVSSINGCCLAPTKPVAGAKQHPQTPQSRGAKQHHPSRRSYHSGGDKEEANGRAVGEGVVEPTPAYPADPNPGKPVASARCGFYVVDGDHGFRTCKQPADASGYCAEHAPRAPYTDMLGKLD
jgi:hypothetical protein